MFDKIEWISVDERKPSGWIVIDAETNDVEPAEYLVHVKGAEYPTFAMFFNDMFRPCKEGVERFADEVDYWAEIPKWEH